MMYQCGWAGRPLFLGIEHCTVPQLEQEIHRVTSSGMSFLVTPVRDDEGYTLPLANRAANGFMTDAFGSTNYEMTMRYDGWTKYIVVKIDCNVDEQPYLREDRGNQIIRLINYMKQLRVPAVIISLRSTDNTNLAKVLGEVAKSPNPMTTWVQVTMDSKPQSTNNFNKSKRRYFRGLNDGQLNDIEKECGSMRLPNSWHCWSTLHEKVDFSRTVHLALELPVMVPEGETIKRWSAEPIAAVVVPSHLFYERGGMPILGYPHQRVLLELLTRTNAVVIIGGQARHPLESYVAYFRRMWTRNHAQIGDKMYHHIQGWADHVQLPTQPLGEDLEVRSYMLLEKDFVKYEFYEKAIMNVLQTKMAFQEMGFPPLAHSCVEDESQLGVIRVAVLGAGQGHLVSLILTTAATLKARVKVYAIEKNQAAALTMETRKACYWIGHDVEILREDFRLSTISPKCDIAVYELLGSWGDNELAPEFIDGARNILRDDCIYIPCRYTSYVAPISSSKVWAAARTGGNSSIFRDDDTFLETIWVSYMKNKMDLGEPKAVFTFKHPSDAVQIDGSTVMEREGVPKVDNSRVANLTWTVNADSVMHGFAGYFHCKLLNESCEFNTLPRTHTKGLITWFPVFIPIKKPMRLRKGYTVNATFWRRTDVGRVWYEWMVETQGNNSGVHNVNGRSSVINCPL